MTGKVYSLGVRPKICPGKDLTAGSFSVSFDMDLGLVIFAGLVTKV